MTPESQSNGAFLWQLLVVLMAVVNVAVGLAKLFGKPKAQELAPNPLNVREHHDFVTKPELAELKSDIAALRDDVDERFMTLAVDRERTLASLHEKINAVAHDIAFIKGKFSKHD